MIEEKILSKLKNLKKGYLEVTLPNGDLIKFGDHNNEPKCDLKIKNIDLIDLAVSNGDIGFGKGYIDDMYETSNLTNLLEFLTLNQKEIEDFFYGKKLLRLFFFIKHLFRKNSQKGSKKNIQKHYDLGNDFYELWLDKSMTYSSGIFKNNSNLANSQKNKYQRILDELNDGPKVLEIGCGWGGFINAAQKQGYKVKGLTLSKEQLDYTNNLIAKTKSDSKAVYQDYRLEKGKYDNIVSIEMFEAVGSQYWPKYFKKISQCLKKRGVAVIQTITINEEFYEKYAKTSDFIREYIFPGGFLPSKEIFENLANKNGLKVKNKFEFGDSYDKTLELWLENFDNVKAEILKLGFDEKFIRMWRFYLAFCMAGFRSKRIDVVQYSLEHL